MRAPAEALATYVPLRVVERLRAGGVCGPFVERFPAALLFADISGSTALAERLAARGPSGAEEFSRLLNTYLGALIDVVTAHGGDVVKFAGDGLLAVWPSPGNDLAAATRCAAECALAAQRAMAALGGSEAVQLSMSIGVGAGEVTGIAVGVPEDRMEYLIVGTPVMETCQAEQMAAPGEVALTAAARRALGDAGAAVPLAFGGARLKALPACAALQPSTMPSVNDQALAALRPFAPPAIVACLSAGQDDWLAELRHVTIVFGRLRDWSGLTFSQVQELTALVLRVVTRYQGTLTRLGSDAHGPVAQFAFGLPPLAHEDDPLRSVQAALDMRAMLQARGVRLAIGVATGLAFCGAVGSARRREYTTVGDAVNVAARLMDAAGDGILCDAATARACGDHLVFDSLSPIQLKGKASPLAVYLPRGRSRTRTRPRPDVIGRTAERAQLRQRLHTLINDGIGGVVLIEGEAGIGKSRLAADLCAQAQAVGATPLLGSCDAIEVATAYHAWRPVVSHLFRLDALPDERMTRRAHVLVRLDAESAGTDAPPSLLQLAPLLNAVLPLDIPENEFTEEMSGETRADNLHELLVKLLERAARQRPVLLVFEDAHWMDSASWVVTLLASHRVGRLLLVVVTRPPGEPQPVEYRRLLHAPATQRVVLDALSPDETVALVCQRLGVTSLSPPVAALIQERAGGHPFFAEELAYTLRDAAVITTVGAQSHLALGANALEQLVLPRTLHGLISSRVDRLTPRQQLTVKVASVLGRQFSLEALRHLHPIEGDKAGLADDMAALERLDLIRADTSTPAPSYVFRHVVTQQVVYQQLAFTQRRQLHRAAAEWYERTYADDLAPFAALLAHHWSRALDAQPTEGPLLEKALDALQRAGEQAVRNYAHREAIRFFADAVRLQPPAAQTQPGPRRRRAHWERQLGEAYFRLGRAVEADTHLRAAVALLDHPVPSTSAGYVSSLAGESVRQLAHRLLPHRFVGRARRAARDHLREAARVYELLGTVWFMMMKSVPSLLANLRCLNLAETAGPSAEVASGCAMAGLLTGTFFGPRIARRYFQRGLDTALQVRDRYGLGRLLQSQGFYLTGQARWDEAELALERARMIFAQLGDTRWQEMATLTLGNTHQMHRRYGDSMRLYTAARQTSLQRGDVQAQAWAAIGMVGALHALGRNDEALRAYDAMAALLENSFEFLSDRGSEFSVCGVRALAHWQRGEHELAREYADKASRISAQSPLLVYYALPGYTSVAEVRLSLWKNRLEDELVMRRQDVRAARRAVTELWRFARFFPIAQPQAWLWRGLYDWLCGRRRKARPAWDRSLAAAERLDMRLEQGMAHVEIGRHLPPGDVARAAHLQRACHVFGQVGARYHLRRAQAALDTPRLHHETEVAAEV